AGRDAAKNLRRHRCAIAGTLTSEMILMRNDVTARSTEPLGAADYNRIEFEDFDRLRPFSFDLVANCDRLNRKIAREAVDLIKAAHAKNQPLLMILPVGPLDYSYWARL